MVEYFSRVPGQKRAASSSGTNRGARASLTRLLMDRRHAIAIPLALGTVAGAVSLSLHVSAGQLGPIQLAVFMVTLVGAGWTLNQGVRPEPDVSFDTTSSATSGTSAPIARRRIGFALLTTAFALGAWAVPTFHREWRTLLPIWLFCCILAVIG